MQEVVVSAAIVGAGVGSAVGGWLSDQVGRRRGLITADVLFTAGALAMGCATHVNVLILGATSTILPLIILSRSLNES